jgi:alkanesulfonate monooxygenase SsuD/methylene tetrahydromethanopterin reductase-like flavin-dependent oxidoreductase (luciferase family)
MITGAGIAPPPVQRPIPIWIGADSVAAYRRVGRLADGWFPQMPPGPELTQAKRVVDQAAVDAGRDPRALGMEGRISYGTGPDAVAAEAAEWEKADATHVCINTMGAGLARVDDHIRALAQVASTLAGMASATARPGRFG